MIYFAHAEGTDRVKIGFTAGDPAKRLADLQTGCPHRLSLLLVVEGGEQDEAEYHKEFATFRVHGEWFQLTVPFLLRLIHLARREDWEIAKAVARLESRVEAVEKHLTAGRPSEPTLPVASTDDGWAWWHKLVDDLASRRPILASHLRHGQPIGDYSAPFPPDGSLPPEHPDHNWREIVDLWFPKSREPAARACSTRESVAIVEAAIGAARGYRGRFCVTLETSSGCESLTPMRS